MTFLDWLRGEPLDESARSSLGRPARVEVGAVVPGSEVVLGRSTPPSAMWSWLEPLYWWACSRCGDSGTARYYREAVEAAGWHADAMTMSGERCAA